MYLPPLLSIIHCESLPVTTITTIVEIMVITHIGKRIGCNVLHLVINPTPAGINIIGIISIKNLPVSFTESSLMKPNNNPLNINSIPYVLAGMGNGSR